MNTTKISGSFRTLVGAAEFAAVRGYLSTLRKPGHSVMEALLAAYLSSPLMPAAAAQHATLLMAW